MRILNIEIQNVRGIKDRLIFSPDGDNFLVYGPNGTGKSAIVDALDFLFSGRISRLVGKGTKNISLKKHGPHIDVKKPESAAVRATIKIPGSTDPIEIERRMSAPNNLICPEDKKDALKKVVAIAERGHYVLSRREVLKFVAAEPGERAGEVQAVLNLETVEEIRKALVKVETDAKRDNQTAQVLLNTSKTVITTLLSLDSFSEEPVLKKINDLRSALSGEPLTTLTYENLQENIRPPSLVESKTIINVDLLTKDIDAAKKIVTDHGESAFLNEEKLRKILRKLKEDTTLRRELANKRLLDLGLSLIDASGACPLCLTAWKPGELKNFLEGRLLKAEEASKIETEIRKLSTNINSEISTLKNHLEKIRNPCLILKQDEILNKIQRWIDILSKWSEDLTDPIEKYDADETIPVDMKAVYAYSNYVKDFETIKKGSIAAAPDLSPEQKAWDTLTRMGSELKRYFDGKETKESAELFSNNPKGRVPRAVPVGEWELALRASSIACVLERVPRVLPVGIYKSHDCIKRI
jgi:hypothetical protein